VIQLQESLKIGICPEVEAE